MKPLALGRPGTRAGCRYASDPNSTGSTFESIADRLVFNRSQKGNLRPPWPREKKGTQSAVVGSLLGLQAGIRNAKQRTPAQPSETFVGATLHDVLKLTLRPRQPGIATASITNAKPAEQGVHMLGMRVAHFIQANRIVRPRARNSHTAV
jgi:hypothetical protein